MRVVALVLLYICHSLAVPSCNQKDVTLNCKDIEWTDLSTYSNLSTVERLILTRVSGTEPWKTAAFSAVNFVNIDSGLLMFEPFQSLVQLRHLSTLLVKNTPVECWSDGNAGFMQKTNMGKLEIINGFNCNNSLKFTFPTTLHELDISENWLDFFPVIEAKMLTYLRLSGDNLHNVGNLSRLPNLFELDLSRNPLAKIPLHAFDNNLELVRLNLSSTSLETVNFVAPFLEILNLSFNYIRTLERSFFAAMPYLTDLDLTGNEITDLSDQFKDLSKLSHLRLSRNYLTKLKPETFTGLHALETLKLDSNRLSSLPELHDDLPSLHLLDISNNSIAILDSRFFSRVSFVATLFASFNGLKSIDDAAPSMMNLKRFIAAGNFLEVDSRTFASMEQLNTVDMSYNELSMSLDVFASNLALKDLKLMHNRISDICGEQHLPLQLGSVNIAYNHVSDIDCLEGLYSLNISGNPLTCGDRLKRSLKAALDSDYDSNEHETESERITIQDNTEDEWKEVYRSVCPLDTHVSDPVSEEIIESSSSVAPKPMPTPGSVNDDHDDDDNIDEDDHDDEYDDDDDEEEDDKIEGPSDYHDLEEEMEIIQNQELEHQDHFWRYKSHSGSKSVLLWAAIGFTAFGFALLSMVAIVYTVIWVQNRRKNQLRSKHVSSYEQLKSPVYNETTSRVQGSNFSANLGRVLTVNPIAGAFKSESVAGVFGRLGFKSHGPEDELEVKMISDSNTSLA